MLLIILLPIVIGFMIALTQYSRLKFMELFLRTESFIRRFPRWVKEQQKIIGDLLYKYRDLPKLKIQTRNGNDTALAKRLQNSDRGASRGGDPYR